MTPLEECRARFERAQQAMAGAAFDALLVTAEANTAYFSGYRHFAPWTTFTRPLILLLPQRGTPMAVVHSLLEPEFRRVSWITDVRGYVDLFEGPIDTVVDELRALGVDRGTIGAELGYEQRLGIPHNDFLRLKSAVSEAQFLDASDVIWHLRMVKSRYEIERLRRSCAIVTKAFDQAFAVAAEGVSQQEVAQAIRRSMVEQGADRVGFILMTSGPGEYERLSSPPGERILRRGDLLLIDMGAVYDGYWSDFCRAGVVGGPSSRQSRLQETVYQATSRGVASARPGVPVAAIARVVDQELQREGHAIGGSIGRIGHGIGLMSTEPPHVALYDKTLLEPGMSITLEPALIDECGVFQVEMNLVVTEDGPDILSTAPWELRSL